ncbi:hypothetical protein JG688_00005380 [Phytophthora aleatoria]|uniref:RxLR effector protein n=1 Tax=Phytophthora aleatoria TaxID=2496075 RepID=A0A8J5M6M0_9STRA|nr:hypothetical protein JG688_00005380 [Phytophthora aleatoria]
MRISYVVLATVLVLAASTEAVVTTTNSVNPAIEDHRFLRVQKNIAMPGIKKVLAGIVYDLLK